MSHAASEWMPWDGEEFWGSSHVAEMSNDEALLYQWALWQNWKSGSIPAQTAALRRILPGRFSECFDAAWNVVRQRFDAGADGRLRNARVAKDLCAAADRVAKCAVAGRASAVARRTKLASVASEQAKPVERPFNVRSTDAQHGADGIGSESSVPTEQGSGKPSRSRKARGSRPPNTYEAAWYEETRTALGTEPAKLAPHAAIALGRIGKQFGPEALRSKLMALYADEKLRKFATPKYLEDHWDTIAAKADLFSGPQAPPAFLDEARKVLAMGPPPAGNRNAEATWKAIQDGLAKYGMTADDLRRRPA